MNWIFEQEYIVEKELNENVMDVSTKYLIIYQYLENPHRSFGLTLGSSSFCTMFFMVEMHEAYGASNKLCVYYRV